MTYAFTDEEGEFLVKLARESLSYYIKNRKVMAIPSQFPEKLKMKSGVFVTLNNFKGPTNSRDLRGCIGRPYPNDSLIENTIISAVDAGMHDPRFPHVRGEELNKIQFEVTALTPPVKIEAKNTKELMDAIVIGRDGLIIESRAKYGYGSGLFLPQVPVEWHWNKEEYLTELCNKAGISEHAWKDLNAVSISKFQGEIFEEEIPNGKIIRIELKVDVD